MAKAKAGKAKGDQRQAALALERAGRLAEADRAWQAAARAAPKDARVRLGAARFANRHGADPSRALPHVLELLRLAPRHPLTHQEAAETYCRLERYAEARVHVDKGLKLDGKSADLFYVAATVENRAGRYREAEAWIGKALASRPDHWPSRVLRATILVSGGDMAGAQALCRALLSEQPDSIDVARIYCRTGRMVSDDPVVAHLRDVVLPALPEGARAARAQVETTLGKVAGDEGRHGAAWDHFAAAKAIDPAPYDLSRYRRHVSDLTAGITRAAYLGRGGHASDAPLLIVGMPRSGSTLIEQILASHPQVVSAGESPALRNVAFDMGLPLHDGAAMAAAVTGMTEDEATRRGAAYLSGLDVEPAARILDKRLHNFELLGLFARLFPKGRVLHTLRDPMDNCVSVYCQAFRKTHAYAWRLEHLGAYYREYRRLMEHWQRELPLPILDVVYEDTVADIEATARRIVDFAGLEWDDACLSFQEAENRSRTLSQWQVRQPVYTTSVQRWRRYGDRVAPLKSALAPLYPGGLD